MEYCAEYNINLTFDVSHSRKYLIKHKQSTLINWNCYFSENNKSNQIFFIMFYDLCFRSKPYFEMAEARAEPGQKRPLSAPVNLYCVSHDIRNSMA